MQNKYTRKQREINKIHLILRKVFVTVNAVRLADTVSSSDKIKWRHSSILQKIAITFRDCHCPVIS